MVTLTFLFIAWLIRKRFVPEGTSRISKVFYYLFCVTMTPLFGPWIFKFIADSKVMTPEEEKKQHGYGYTYPGFFS